MRSLRAAAAAAAVALLLLAIVATPASSQEVAITPAAVSVDTPLPRGGEAALPAVVVRNRGSSAIPIRMSAIGENAAVAAWARFGPDAFDLDPGESRLVEVYLDIPRDAALETHRLLLRAAIPTDTGSGGVRLSVSLAVASAIEFEVGEAVATGAGPWMRYGLPLLLGIAGGALTVVGVPGLWRSLRRLASLRLRAPSLPGLRRNAAPPLKRHPDVERAVEALLAEVRAILGARFVAMYLEGSLAGGGFAPPRSDIDVVVVTEGDLPLEVVAALAAMHARLSFDVPWGDELEVSYLPREVVRRHDPTHVEHPRIGRYEGLTVQEHGREWDIHRRILRERGITVAGPPPADLVDPVSDADLRLAVRESLEAWAIHLDDPAALRDTLRDAGRDLPARARGGYQPYVVLTMCRALYTLEAGGVASKPEAGAWARHILGEPSASLIAWALTWRPDTHTDRSDDIVAVVRVTLDRARRLDEPGA